LIKSFPRRASQGRSNINVEQLIGLAGARGVDLTHAAGAAIETKGIARNRERTDHEIELGVGVRETAFGRQTRTSRRAAWSLAELGQAAVAGGVHGSRWLAVRYSIAGDSSCADELWSCLAYHGSFIARREWWPAKVLGSNGRLKFYREDLAQLVLDADAHRHYFAAAPALYAACMDITPPEWDRTLSGPFRSLKTVYEGWINSALAGIRRGLRGD
jgi:hypothetical protein